MLFLLALVLSALRFGRRPLLAMALLCVLTWDYFFIPPRFGFGIHKLEDALMCGTFFVVVLGICSALLRHRDRAGMALRLAEVAEASDHLRHTLLDSVSHELKTPIAALQSAIDEMSADPPESHRYVPELRGALRRLRRTVDNLLNMTRLESGAVKPMLDWCHVDELCDDAVDMIGDALIGHRFYVKVSKTLPMVKIDRALIEQALVNLLLNSAMHTPAGTAVTLRARLENGELVLSVLDRGPGLPADDAEVLFQKFARGENAPAGGSGLGLAIARGFVRAHSGEVRARNLAGGGAEFALALPVETLEESLHETDQADSSDH
jgi:two-component system sensor histidine kinase KdpD